MPFHDRAEAGRRLAALLVQRGLNLDDAVVLGLPRGGVPVAFEVAQVLGLALDVIIVRKLGVPFHPELAMGAIGEGGVRIENDEVVRSARIDAQAFAQVEQKEKVELERRARRYRGDRQRADLRGRTALVVDDGVATGSTAMAACSVARAQGATRVIMAVPVAPTSAIADLARVCDEVVALESPEWFYGVGEWYRDFSQTSDEEVMNLLKRAASRTTSAALTQEDPEAHDEEIEVVAGAVRLAGHLTVPKSEKGIVIFAHGSGSSRQSSRNQRVAASLNESGFATLLFDLLTTEEEVDRSVVFDIRLLAERLGDVTRWVRAQSELSSLAVGYFGASTGAAAALWAAANRGAISPRWSHGVGVQTLPDRCCQRCAHPHCSLWEGTMRWCSSSIITCNSSSAAQTGCPWFPEPPTSLRNQEPSMRWGLWPLSGSSRHMELAVPTPS